MKAYKTISLFVYLCLVVLLNFAIYKCYENDKTNFYKQIESSFYGINESEGIAYTVEDFDNKTGQWKMEWIVSDYFSVDDATGLVILELTPELNKFYKSSINSSYRAYKFAQSSNKEQDSPFLLHEWNYQYNKPNIEDFINLKSTFFKLQKKDFTFPTSNVPGQTMFTDGITASINHNIKSTYIRVSNGYIYLLFSIANLVFFIIFISLYRRLFKQQISFEKRQKTEAILDKTQNLWDKLERKCNPANFMNPYDEIKVEKANALFEELTKTNNDDIEALKSIRRRAMEELGISLINNEYIEKLKAKCNPQQFLEPYNPEKVRISNIIYSKLKNNMDNIEILEEIEKEIKEKLL